MLNRWQPWLPGKQQSKHMALTVQKFGFFLFLCTEDQSTISLLIWTSIMQVSPLWDVRSIGKSYSSSSSKICRRAAAPKPKQVQIHLKKYKFLQVNTNCWGAGRQGRESVTTMHAHEITASSVIPLPPSQLSLPNVSRHYRIETNTAKKIIQDT